MDRLNIRHYLWVAVAGVFCWLNTSVVSAQTATDLNCNRCVGKGEVARNTVGWFNLDEPARAFLRRRENRGRRFAAQLAAQEERIAALEALVTTLQASSVENLGTYLRIDETDPQKPSAWFEAVNVMVVNGPGATEGTPNGLGNLIVGYDEPSSGPGDKNGSHNLVVGP